MKDVKHVKARGKVIEVPISAIIGLKNDFDESVIGGLVHSLEAEGLINAVTVSGESGWRPRYKLLAGRHRLEAAIRLGWKTIPARVLKASRASSVTLAENLHRKHFSTLDYSLLLVKYLKKKAAELGVESWKDLSSREKLDIARTIMPAAKTNGALKKAVTRAIEIWSLSKEAQKAAKELGLDNHQQALLQAAKEDAAHQVEKLREFASRPRRAVKSGPKVGPGQQAPAANEDDDGTEKPKSSSKARLNIQRRWKQDTKLVKIWAALSPHDKAWFVSDVLQFSTDHNW